MTDDRSLRRERPEPHFHQELAAVLDGADVSERVRAAIAHALSTADPLSPYLNGLLARSAGRERRSGRNQAPAGAYRMPRRWTLHLTYLAADPQEARDQAVVYTEGLTTLRPEVPATGALLSRADAWNHIEPVFCGRVGPDDEVCADVTGHPGFHRAAGLDGLRWGDGDTEGGR
ncbi:hypothetical protein [Micromonospora sp. RP3T]|uniref:hypothetical protein n=1 Tax=Micromonospora sp. RP3T TaxID=2135446 RepID=UPI000D157B0C|nr:hypothetical protein [Micromonospora sp. RP3T]PTA42615.1 hypothetical protein C8054_29900 [Micromonospora sp. RP3T]